MPNTQEYEDLFSWLHRYGNGAVHWTVFADLNLTQQASSALTDLHTLLRYGTDKEQCLPAQSEYPSGAGLHRHVRSGVGLAAKR